MYLLEAYYDNICCGMLFTLSREAAALAASKLGAYSVQGGNLPMFWCI